MMCSLVLFLSSNTGPVKAKTVVEYGGCLPSKSCTHNMHNIESQNINWDKKHAHATGI